MTDADNHERPGAGYFTHAPTESRLNDSGKLER